MCNAASASLASLAAYVRTRVEMSKAECLGFSVFQHAQWPRSEMEAVVITHRCIDKVTLNPPELREGHDRLWQVIRHLRVT